MIVGKHRIALSCLVVAAVGCTVDGGGGGGSTSSTDSVPGSESGTPSPTSGDVAEATGAEETGTPTASSDPSSDASSSSTDGGVQTGECHQAATHPWAGALCGTSGSPCQILVEETLDAAPVAEEFEHFRFSRAAITHDAACAPVVSYGATTSPDDVSAVLARRIGVDDWERVERPDVRRASITWDAPAGVVRLLDVAEPGGARHTTFDGGAFAVQPTPPELVGDAHSLGDGRWHAAVRDTTAAELLHVLEFDGAAWSDTPLAMDPIYDATLALAADGAAHVLMRSLHGDQWALRYAAPPYDAVELVVDLAPAEGVIGPMGLAMVGATPHGFSTRVSPETGYGELVYVTRDDAGEWSVRTLASSASNADTDCPTPVQGAEACEYAFVAHVPQAILASHGGEVRILWSERLLTGTAEASCPEPDGPCVWTPTVEETLNTLWMSTPIEGGFDSVVLLESDFTVEDAEIDGTGRIHIVGSTRVETGSRVEYLLLGE